MTTDHFCTLWDISEGSYLGEEEPGLKKIEICRFDGIHLFDILYVLNTIQITI
jgi:hypothetical protein